MLLYSHNLVYQIVGVEEMSENKNNIELLYKKIKQDIISQQLKPGSRLPERELANKYNVSRTPIRQVLQKLENEGLVEFIRYKGAFVKDITIDEFKDVSEIRMVLEKYAAEKCCDYIDANMLKWIENIIEKQKKACEKNDVREYTFLDQEFHYSIVKAANNKELDYHFRILNHKSYLSRIRTLAMPGRLERSLKEHIEIVNYIKEKKKEQAGEKAAEHVYDGMVTYIQIHSIMMDLK